MSQCLLVGAAPSTNMGLASILEMLAFDAYIAVDGGYETLRAQGIEPDAVFGDFDSLGYTPNHPKTRTFNPHKDFTDMDFAIQYAFEQGFTDVIMCNGLAGRLDHSIGNLQLLARAAQNGQRLWGITEEEVVVCLHASAESSSSHNSLGLNALHFDAGGTGTVSVLSHSDVAIGVTETGFEYGLTNATCTNNTLWGISNELIGKQASITLESGSLWVFFPLAALPLATYGASKLTLKS